MMGGGGRVPLTVFLISLASACATAGGSPRLERAPGGGNVDSAPMSSVERAARFGSWIPTLLVDNVSGDHFAVRLNGLTLGTATGGRNCMLIPLEVGDIVLEFVPVGMDPQLARPVHLEESLHWRVEVGRRGTLEHDLSSLKPAAGSCKT